MKTAKWWFSLAGMLAQAAAAPGALFLAGEEDLRAVRTDRERLAGEIHSIGGSLRKVISDRRGDRLVFFAQAEAAHNLSEGLLHQLYGEWKGPMGRWNIALGRVPLPWGLLAEWSPDRMPFGSPYPGARTLASDNGLLVRGVIGPWDYGVALTQGYGMESVEDVPGPGLATGRLGWAPGLDGGLTLGLTASAGTVFASEHGHGMGDAVEEERMAFAVDATVYLGRGAYRLESGARRTDGRWLGTAFAFVEYAWLPRIDLQLAAQLFRHGEDHAFGRAYAGVSIPWNLATIRGGYEYEYAHEEIHRLVLQLYRYHSVVR